MKTEWEKLAKASTLLRIHVIVNHPENPLSFSIGRYSCIAQVVDAELIKPKTVRFKVEFIMKDRKGLVKARGFVYHSQHGQSGD